MSEKVRPSKYNRLITRPDGERFVFSGCKGTFARIEDEEVLRFLCGRDFDRCDTSALLECGFAVPAELDETSEIFRANRSLDGDDGPVAIQIAPTVACNFACDGCIQGSIHEGRAMGDEVRDAVVSFATSFKRDIAVNWYGGEPTLALSAIEDITVKLLEHAEKNGFQYSASMTTNGYLITEKVARRLVNELRVSSFQVTIDGPERVHNESRPLSDGKGTFCEVLAAVKHLRSCGATVKVRINIDRSNWKNVGELLDLLRGEGLDDILLTPGMKHGCSDSCMLMDVVEFSEAWLSFYELLAEKGFHKAAAALLPHPIKNSCMMSNPRAFLVDPEGYVYKCIDQIGDLSASIGNIVNSGRIDPSDAMEHPPLDGKCRSCINLPICQGACPLRYSEEHDSCDVWRYATRSVLNAFAFSCD